MPKVELYINNQLCDLRGDEEINVDYAIFDISKIGTRGGARSYEFELPKTNRNKLVFENPEIVNNLSDVPYTRLSALVLVDGVDVLIRFCEVSGVKDYYSIYLYGSNSDIFSEFKDIKLSQLSFCGYDHFWTGQTALDSVSNADGYIYPLIDYHEDSPNTKLNNTARVINVANLLPSVFLHTVFTAIENWFGITIVNRLEERANYPLGNIILPFSREEKTRSRNPERYEVTVYSTIDRALNIEATGYAPGTLYMVPFNDAKDGCTNYFKGLPNINVIGFAEQVTCTVFWDLTFTNNLVPVDYNGFIYISSNYDAFGDILLQNLDDFVIVPISIPYGDTVRITGTKTFTTRVSQNTNQDAGIYIMQLGFGLPQLTLAAESYVKIQDVEVLEDGEMLFDTTNFRQKFITISTILPDWTVSKLLLNYCKVFGGVLNFDDKTRQLEIFGFDYIASRISLALDWSGKLNNSENPTLTFLNDTYGRKNNFKYEDDKETLKPLGTDGIIEIDNRNLELEKDIIAVDFGAVETGIRLIDLDIPRIKAWTKDGEEYTGNTYQRIMVLKRYNVSDFENVSIVEYYDGTDTFPSTIAAIPYFIKSGQDFNLGFGDNMLENYYASLAAIIQRLKVVSLPVRLTAADISQLDFTRPVYIAKFEAYFYISAIKGFSYTSNESTMVELVKLNING